MDPRQRSSDERYFRAVRVYLLVGTGLCLFPLGLMLLGVDAFWRAPGRGVPLIGTVVVGLPVVVVALGSLVRRWIKGPDAPGKRARY